MGGAETGTVDAAVVAPAGQSRSKDSPTDAGRNAQGSPARASAAGITVDSSMETSSSAGNDLGRKTECNPETTGALAMAALAGEALMEAGVSSPQSASQEEADAANVSDGGHAV